MDMLVFAYYHEYTTGIILTQIHYENWIRSILIRNDDFIEQMMADMTGDQMVFIENICILPSFDQEVINLFIFALNETNRKLAIQKEHKHIDSTKNYVK